MKNIITTSNKSKSFRDKYHDLDNTCHDQLAEILREQGYSVELKKYSSFDYNIIDKINNLPVYYDGGVNRQTLRIQSVSYRRQNDNSKSVTFNANKEINLKNIKKSIDEILVNITERINESVEKNTKQEKFDLLYNWAIDSNYPFKLEKELKSYIDYDHLVISLKEDVGYESKKLFLDSKFNIINVSIPYNYTQTSKLSFEKFEQFTFHMNLMKQMATEAAEFIEALEQYSDSI